MNSKLPDTSLELILARHREGVILNKPNTLSKMQYTHSLDQIFKLPCNVYFDRYDHVAVDMNELSVKTCGYDSSQDIIGRSGLEFFTKETAIVGAHNQVEVMKSEKVKIIQDTLIRHDEASYSYVSISYPWYSKDDKVIGVFGCSFALHSIAESLEQLYQLGLLSKPKKDRAVYSSLSQYFSARELQCIEFIMQGKSIKEIAKVLSLSPRTVEHYIENIKNKANVRTKAELMAKVNEWLTSD